MNKFFKIFKHALLIALTIIVILFIKKYKFDITRRPYVFSWREVVLLGLFIIYLAFDIYDLIKFKKDNRSTMYYIVNSLALLTMISVFGRCVFDPSIIANMKNLSKSMMYHCSMYGFELMYFFHHYFEALIILLLVYRFSCKKSTK